jgi:hypothetical protein
MSNGGGRCSERERERDAELRLGKKMKKKKERLTTGVGYSGQAALRREQCDVHAVARLRSNKGGYLGND